MQVELNMLQVDVNIGGHRVGLEPADAEVGWSKEPREQATHWQALTCTSLISLTLSTSGES